MGDSVVYASDYPPAMGFKYTHTALIPDIGYCAEKNRLMRQFVDAIHDLGTLQSQQANALIGNDPDFGRFDQLLHEANEKKDRIKYSWLAHVDQHGC